MENEDLLSLSNSDSYDKIATTIEFHNYVKAAIFRFINLNFKVLTSEKSYEQIFIDLSFNPLNVMNIASIFEMIKSLDPLNYRYGLSYYADSDSVILHRVCISTTEEFNNEIASNYFNVDEIWRDELRGIKK